MDTHVYSSAIHQSQRWKQPKCPSLDGWINSVYPHNRISFCHRKEWSTGTCYNVDELWTHAERSQTQKVTYCVIPFTWSAQNRQIHRARMQIGCHQRQGHRAACWKGTRFPLGVMKMFGTRQNQWLHNLVNALNATEFFTLKWLVLCYANFTSKKKKGTHFIQPLFCRVTI